MSRQNFSILIALLFSSIGVMAQSNVKWVSVDQPYYGMRYQLPEDWEVDGFSSSAVCNCPGTINIGDRYGENEVFMVVYPMKSENSFDSTKHTFVWSWQFQESTLQTKFKSEKLVFNQTKSSWKAETADTEEERLLEVWRFTTSFKNQYYVFYFWANAELMLKNETVIYEILHRFEPVSVKGKNW